jgi:LPXTG-motif cell wall-anchored protein
MTYRPNIGRFAAAAATALMLVGVTPVAASASTEADVDVTEGALDWGVKESFRAYVVSPIAAGEIEVLDGASRNSDGTFHFAGGTGTVGGGNGALAFAGAVRFTGHDGTLEVIISNPAVQIDGTDGSLIADVSSLSLDGELAEFPDVVLAALDLSGASLEPDSEGVVSVAGVAATLTEAGAPAFGGFYEAGEALDPVSFAVQTSAADDSTDPDPADDSADDSDGPDATDASGDENDADSAGTVADDEAALPKTGAPWALLAVGGLVLVAIGAAFVLLGRRHVGEGA